MTRQEYQHTVISIKDKLFRFALRYLKNPPEAEDVVQEVFIKIWNQRNELGHINSIEGWCMTLTRNMSIDKLRSSHSKTREIPEGYDMVETAATPEEQTEQSDTFHQVEMMMQALPEKQRLTMHLRDIEGLSYKEIAEQLELPMNQVKVNLFRARKAIREKLLEAQSFRLQS